MFGSIYKNWEENKQNAIFDGNKFYSYSQLYSSVENLRKLEPTSDLWVLDIPKSYDYLVALLYCIIYQKTFVPINPEVTTARKKIILDLINGYSYFSLEKKKNFHNLKTKDFNGDYIIFSSGSTGSPKGILGNINAVSRVIAHQVKLFNLTPFSRVLWILNIGFDASLSDVLTTFMSGACLYLPSFNPHQLKKMQNFIRDHEITHIDIPPSILNLLLPGTDLSSLQTIIVGGELLSPKTLKRWAEHVKLINCYGPTETSICSSYQIFNKNSNPQDISEIIDGNKFYLIQNEEIKPLENSEGTGELVIGGENLSYGYLNNLELNKNKFFLHNGLRLYKTGDQVFNKKDALHFLGRVDRQIKIHGNLISPEEIEKSILDILDTSGCVVKKIDDHLEAWLIGKIEDESFLKFELLKLFENFMIPKKFHFLNSLPKNSNGKINWGVVQ